MELCHAILLVNAGAKRKSITPDRRKELYALKRRGIEYGLANGLVQPNGVHNGYHSFMVGSHRFHQPIDGVERLKLESSDGPKVFKPTKRQVYVAARFLKSLPQ